MRPLIYIIIILLTPAIWSCRSTRYVPVESQILIKDSVNIRDSIITKEVINKKDSIVMRDSFVTVVDNEGNVLRTELYKQKEVYKDMQREYNALLAKYNSLLYQERDSIRVPYPVEAQLSRWQEIKLNVGGYAITSFVIILLIVVVWTIYKLIK